MSHDVNCPQKQISAEILETAVWTVVNQMVMEPTCLIEKLDARLEEDENSGLKKQVNFLGRQLADCQQEDEKLYRAFVADIFDEDEYAAKRKQLKEKVALLEKERAELSSQVISHEQVEADKAMILAFASRAQEMGIDANTSFELKQRMLKMLVDKITLNVNERRFHMEGYISGTWLIDQPDEPQVIPASDNAIVNGSACRLPRASGRR